MAGVYGHLRVAKRVLYGLGLQNPLGQCLPAYIMGSQGPDFCFYTYLRPKVSNRKFLALSRLLHGQKVDAFLEQALQYAHDQRGEQLPVRAYILGYLTHYVVDTEFHPYIHYFCNGSNNHILLESAIDWELKKMDDVCSPLHVLLGKMPEAQRIAVGQMYGQVILKVYGERYSAQTIANLIGDMPRIHRIMNDPLHCKRLLFSPIAAALGIGEHMKALFYGHKREEAADYLNLSHQQWRMPFAQGEARRTSVLDIFDACELRAKQLVKTAWAFLNDLAPLNMVMQRIDRRAMSTGASLDGDATIRYTSNRFF